MGKENSSEKNPQGGITRGNFLKISALLGGTALLAGCGVDRDYRRVQGGDVYELAKPENIITSSCHQCSTTCGIKVKVLDGVVTKIDGNPFSPWTTMPHVDYTTPIADAAFIDTGICPKGQSGAQSTYDPYRLVKVIKRDGPRGSNKWKTISFEQALNELTNGGKLFANVPGEENRQVEGLKDICALRDAEVMDDMKKDISGIWAAKDKAAKEALVNAFKEKFKDDLDKMIDPNHPDLGPKNNQLCFMCGRVAGGREHLITRFTKDGFGSINRHGHTTVCQGSMLHAAQATTEQFNPQTGSFSGGAKFYWASDLLNSEFVIFTGSSPFEASFGPPGRVARITEGLDSGRLKMAIVDPRFSKTASKAWKWIPALPGSEGAMALALMGWIIENKRYDATYLTNSNKAAASADGEPTWSNATWLVKLDDSGMPIRLLRGSDIGIDETEFGFDPPIVMSGGQPTAFDPNSTTAPMEGELMVDETVAGHQVKSSLQILWEEASCRTMEEWSEICGVKAEDLIEVAREFTSHGKKAAADFHRGVSQHTNGFYNATAWWNLNMLIGNYDWQGGMLKPAAYDMTGKKANGPFKVEAMKPHALEPFGIMSTRQGATYENTTLFMSEGYPAKRNWFPISDSLYQEIIPSAGDKYPYDIKALFIYMGSPVYVTPAGDQFIKTLSDPEKIPLIISSDIVVGDTSMFADYIFPDLTNLERWEFSGSKPSIPYKSQTLHQPTIAPLTDIVNVFGQEMPISLEAMLLGLAEKLDLPAFGPNGMGEGVPLTHQDNFYLRMVGNLAHGEKADGSDIIPDASDEEINIFLKAREHLPKYIFDADRWRNLVGDDLWPKVVYVLNRGGRFQVASYPDNQLAGNRYGKMLNFFQEKTAAVRNSQTGQLVPGHATYITPCRDIYGNQLDDEKEGYDLKLITYREISRTPPTPGNYWLSPLLPGNSILLNKQDADRIGLEDGDVARITSFSNPEGVWNLQNGQKWPMEGQVSVMQGIRPGVIAFSLGHGHFAYGGVDITIDGQTIKGDKSRVTGINANAAMRVEPNLKNTCLVDTVGGSAVFFDTFVKLEKV